MDTDKRHFILSTFITSIVLLVLFVIGEVRPVLAQSPLENSSKTAQPGTTTPGEAITYTIVLSNHELVDVEALLTDPIPDNTTYITHASSSGFMTYTDSPGLIKWSGAISAQDAVSLTYQVHVDDTLVEPYTFITNTATITTNSPLQVKQVSATVRVDNPDVDALAGSMSVVPSIAYADTILTYDVLVQNVGMLPATNTILQASIPANAHFVSSSTDGASFDSMAGQITWSGTISGLQTFHLTYDVQVDSSVQPFDLVTSDVTMTSDALNSPWSGSKTVCINCGPASGAMYLADPQRTGQVASAGYPLNPVLQLMPKWSYPTGGAIQSSPVISPDGKTVLFGSTDQHVYAINPETPPLPTPDIPPVPIMDFDTGAPIYSTMALAQDGTIIVGAGTQVKAILPDGSGIRWSYDTGSNIFSSPVLDEENGTIYINTSDGTVHAINPGDGSQKWTYETGESISYSSPTIASDGTVFVATKEYLYAFDTEGELLWKTKISLPPSNNLWDSSDSTPTIGPDGSVYLASTFASTFGYVFAFNPDDGSFKQNFPVSIGGPIYGSPTLNQDGSTLYIGAGSSLMAIQTDDGSVSLVYSTPDAQLYSPIVDGDGKIYLPTSGGNIYVLTSTGIQIGSYTTGTSGIDQSVPAIAADGTVYIGTEDGKLLALVEDNTPMQVTLEPDDVDETATDDTPVGELKTVAPVQDTFIYSFTAPYFDADGRFKLVGDQILVNDSLGLKRLDLETPPHNRSYQISIKSTVSGGLFREENITIDINPVNEFPPTAIYLLNDTTAIDETNTATNPESFVDELVVDDLDYGDTHTYIIQNDECDAFTIRNGNQLHIDNFDNLDYETIPDHICTIRIRVTNPPQSPIYQDFDITINDVPEPPVAEDDFYFNGVEENPLIIDIPARGVLANDNDPEQTTLRSELVSPPTDGQLVLNNDGTFTYTPDQDFYGTDTFEYRAIDADNQQDRATVTIEIAPINDCPEVSINDPLVLDEGKTGSISSALLKYTDVDNSDDELTYTLTNRPSHGTLKKGGMDFGATFTQQDIQDGLISYTHDGSETSSDSFIFTVSDGTCSISNQTFWINITAANDAPVLRTNKTLQVVEGKLGTIDETYLLVEDVDNTLQEISFEVVSKPSHGTLYLNGTGVQVGGTFSQEDVNAGLVTYQHDGSETDHDSFVFKVRDGAGGEIGDTTFLIQVIADNDPPVLITNKPLELNETGTKTIDSSLLHADDVDNTPAEVYFRIEQASDHGTLKRSGISMTTNSTFFQQDIDDNLISYTHDGSETTEDSFVFVVCDLDGCSPNQTFNIVITLVDDSPTISSIDDQVIDEDTSTAPLPFMIDDEDTNISELQLRTESSNTFLFPNDSSHISLSGTGTNRSVVLTPATNKFGSATITICVSDGSSEACEVFTVTVRAVADKPIVSNASTNEDTMTSNGLAISRGYGDGTEVTHFRITDITGGTLFKHDGSTVISNGNFITVAEGNAELRFKPSQDSTTEGHFTVYGALGAAPSLVGPEGAEATITVIPVNDPPLLVKNEPLMGVVEDGSGTIGANVLKVTDVDNQPSELTYEVTDAPSKGKLWKNKGSQDATILGNYSTFTQQDIDDNKISYEHDGSAVPEDSFVFIVSDGGQPAGEIGETIFAINDITSRNDSPELMTNSPLTLDEGFSQCIDATHLLVEDEESDPDQILYTLKHIPTSGVLTLGSVDLFEGNHFTQQDIEDGDVVCYTHHGEDVESDSFEVRVTDGEGGSIASVTFLINIKTKNDDPTLSTIDDQTIEEDTTLRDLLVVIGDEETDAGTLSLGYSSSNINLVDDNGITISGSGASRPVTITPKSNKFGTTTIEICVYDEERAEACEPFDLTVNPVADTPSVTNAETDEEIQTSQGLIISRNDADGSEVTHYRITNISHGTLFKNDGATIINPNDFITTAEGALGLKFTPEQDFASEASFDVQASLSNDTAGLGGDLATATIQVNEVNDPPVLQTKAPLTVGEGQSKQILNTLLKVTDNESSPADIVYTMVEPPDAGELTRNGTTVSSFTQEDIDKGLIRYEHDGSETTSDYFSFQVQDGGRGEIDTTSFSIDITSINDIPELKTNKSLKVDEGGTAVIGSDVLEVIDGDGIPRSLVYTLVTKPLNGTLWKDGEELTVGKTFTQDNIEKDEIYYTHDGSETTSDSFKFTVSDGRGGLIDTSTFQITIISLNDAPGLTENNPLEIDEGHAGSITDQHLQVEDIDSTPDQITYTLLSKPSHGDLRLSGLPLDPDTNNTFTQQDINNDKLSYLHDGSSSIYDSFEFTIQGTSGHHTFHINVTPVNDAPVIATIVDQKTQEDVPTAPIAFWVSDEETSDNSLTVSFTSSDTSIVPEDNIVVSGSRNWQQIIITPAQDAFGPVVIEVCVTDADQSSVCEDFTLTVEPDADTPQVSNAETDEDQQTTSGLVITRNPADGTEVGFVKITNIAGGVLFKPDGTTPINHGDFISLNDVVPRLKFTPLQDSNSPGSFVVQASTTNDDNGLGGNPIPAAITVRAVNDAPMFDTNESLMLKEGQTDKILLSSYLKVTDVDNDAEDITFTLITLPSHGTLMKNSNPLTPEQGFTQDDINRGVIQYTHDGSETTGDSMVFTVSDGSGGSIAETTFWFTITPVNEAPSAVGDTIEIAEGETVTLWSPGLLENDTDPDGNELRVQSNPVSGPRYGQLHLSTSGDGSLIYTHNDSKNYEDYFTYQVCDEGGLCDKAEVFITIEPVNDTPVLVNHEPLVLSERQSKKLLDSNLKVTDADNDAEDITFTVVTLPSHGTLMKNSVPFPPEQDLDFTQHDIDRGIIQYTHDGSETTSDKMVFTVSDGAGGFIAETTFWFTITPVNEAPSAVDDTIEMTEGETVTLPSPGLLENDTDPDGDELHVQDTPVSGPYHGLLDLSSSGDGSLIYTHDGSETVEDSFTYEVCDEGDLCDEAEVSVTIEPVNDTPVLVNHEPLVLSEGQSRILLDNNLNVTDGDQDATDVTFIAVTLPSHGTLMKNSVPFTPEQDLDFTQHDINRGIIQYTHDGSETTSDKMVFTVSDGSGGFIEETTFSFIIIPVNEAPSALNDPIEVNEGGTVTVPSHAGLLKNDTDPDGDELHVQDTPVSGPYYGSLELSSSGDGSFTYAHNGSKNYEDSFTYQVCDEGNLCDEAEATITIYPDSQVIIEESDGNTSVEEGGSGDSYKIKLAVQPTDNVEIQIATDGQTIVEPTYLQFTQSNWNTFQPVSVRSQDDSDIEGPHTSRIMHDISQSDDPDYRKSFVRDVVVYITDNDIDTDTDTDANFDLMDYRDLPENSPGGSFIGQFILTTESGMTVPASYTLKKNPQGLFTIDEDELQVAEGAILDYEDTQRYEIEVTAKYAQGTIPDKPFTIDITDVNEPPVGIEPDELTLRHGTPDGFVFASLSTDDPDEDEEHTYTLLETDGLFNIIGEKLVVADSSRLVAGRTYHLRVRSTDSEGAFCEAILRVSIVDPDNQPPTDIVLDPSTVKEHSAPRSFVGVLTAEDPDDPEGEGEYTYELLDGAHGQFFVIDDVLRVADSAYLDYETNDEHTIEVKVTDGGGLSFTKELVVKLSNILGEPEDIGLSNNKVPENADPDHFVGDLSASPSYETYTFSLVDTAGGIFKVEEDKLLIDKAFLIDRDVQKKHTIRVRATNRIGGIEKPFDIYVSDVVGDPTDIELEGKEVNEHSPDGQPIGIFSAQDPDLPDDTHDYRLLDDLGGRFVIDGSQLKVGNGALLDYEVAVKHTITVIATDSSGLNFAKSFDIMIRDVEGDPTDIELSDDVIYEHSPVDSPIGTLSTEDPDNPEDHTYSVVGGAVDIFKVAGDELQVADSALLDYETTAPTHSYTVTIRTTDEKGLSFDKTLTIYVNDRDDDPIDIYLTNQEVQQGRSFIGTFSTEGPHHPYSYKLLEDADGLFRVEADGLYVADASRLSDGIAAEYEILVRSSDESGLSCDRPFTIIVNNEPPSATGNMVFSSQYVLPNQWVLVMAKIHRFREDNTHPSEVNLLVDGEFWPLLDDGEFWQHGSHQVSGDVVSGDGIYSAYVNVGNVQDWVSLNLQVDGTTVKTERLIADSQKAYSLLVLTDYQELIAEFQDTCLDLDDDNFGSEFFDLVERMQRYATEHKGIVLDIARRVDTYRNNPYAVSDGTANRHKRGQLIDELIHDAVLSTKQPDDTYAIEHVAIIGDDQVVPFYRVFAPTNAHPRNPIIRDAEKQYGSYYGSPPENPVLYDVWKGYIMSDVPYSVMSVQDIGLKYDWLKHIGELDDGGSGNASVYPLPDLGIGRIFAVCPAELVTAIDRASRPLAMDAGVVDASLLIGMDHQSITRAEVNFPEMLELGFLPYLPRWVRDYTFVDAATQDWPFSETRRLFAEALSRALEERDFVFWTGHASHDAFKIRDRMDKSEGDPEPISMFGSDITFVAEDERETSVLVAGLGCHMGLSVCEQDGVTEPTSDYQNDLAGALIGHGKTFLAPSSYGYIYQKRTYKAPGLHELMVSLFVNGLQDYGVATVGDLWKQTHNFYKSADPRVNFDYEADTNNPENRLLHLTGVYGVVLYGLPTQQIRSERNMCKIFESQQEANPAPDTEETSMSSLASSPLPGVSLSASSPDTGQAVSQAIPLTDTIIISLALHIEPRTINEKGEVIFEVLEGGTLIAPPHGAILPLVIPTYVFTEGVQIEGVRLLEKHPVSYPGPVTLAKAVPQIISGGVVSGSYKLSKFYPTNIYTYTTIPRKHGTMLSINVIPMQYKRDTHQVELYDYIEFAVDISIHPSGNQQGASASIAQSFQNTEKADISSEIDKETGIVTLNIPKDLVQEELLVYWTFRNLSRNIIDSGFEPVLNVTETGEFTFTLGLDTLPNGYKYFDVELYSCKIGDTVGQSDETFTVDWLVNPLWDLVRLDVDNDQSFSKIEGEAVWKLKLTQYDGEVIFPRTGYSDKKPFYQSSPVPVERIESVALRIGQQDIPVEIGGEKPEDTNKAWLKSFDANIYGEEGLYKLYIPLEDIDVGTHIATIKFQGKEEAGDDTSGGQVERNWLFPVELGGVIRLSDAHEEDSFAIGLSSLLASNPRSKWSRRVYVEDEKDGLDWLDTDSQTGNFNVAVRKLDSASYEPHDPGSFGVHNDGEGYYDIDVNDLEMDKVTGIRVQVFRKDTGAEDIESWDIQPKPIVIEPTSICVDEDGKDSFYKVRLTIEPTATVKISTRVTDTSVVVTPTVLTFHPEFWDDTREIRVQALDNGSTHGEREISIQHKSSSETPYFHFEEGELEQVVLRVLYEGTCEDPGSDPPTSETPYRIYMPVVKR